MWRDALVLAPPSARGSRWMHRFLPASTGFASGWMAVRHMYRQSRHDRGFALSDHADWDALNTAIAQSQAEEVWVTHGYREELVRWLHEQGRVARAVSTRFTGEEGAATGETAEPG
jgi:putative mRNA 3-end processing factor